MSKNKRQMITKKNIKQIKEGNHAVLMDCLNYLLDTYEEDKFDLGYKSCLADMSVRSQRLAEYIGKKAKKQGKTGKDFDEVYFLDQDDLAKVIETYFNKALNE